MGYGLYFCATRAGSKDCLWYGSFKSADKKQKVLLSGFVVPLQPLSPEPGAFLVSWQCLSRLPLALGMEEEELLHHHFQTPTSITAPSVFPSFAFFLDEAEDLERVVCCF